MQGREGKGVATYQELIVSWIRVDCRPCDTSVSVFSPTHRCHGAWHAPSASRGRGFAAHPTGLPPRGWTCRRSYSESGEKAQNSKWMNEWMKEWTNEWMDGWMNAWRNEGWMDEGMKEGMNGWMAGWTSERMEERKEWIDAWINGRGWMDQWMDGWMDKIVPKRKIRKLRRKMDETKMSNSLCTSLQQDINWGSSQMETTMLCKMVETPEKKLTNSWSPVLTKLQLSLCSSSHSPPTQCWLAIIHHQLKAQQHWVGGRGVIIVWALEPVFSVLKLQSLN